MQISKVFLYVKLDKVLKNTLDFGKFEMNLLNLTAYAHFNNKIFIRLITKFNETCH